MKKTFCDKCEKPISAIDDKIEVWDKSFRRDLDGVIWSISARGNFMDAKVDVCHACLTEALHMLFNKVK